MFPLFFIYIFNNNTKKQTLNWSNASALVSVSKQVLMTVLHVVSRKVQLRAKQQTGSQCKHKENDYQKKKLHQFGFLEGNVWSCWLAAVKSCWRFGCFTRDFYRKHIKLWAEKILSYVSLQLRAIRLIFHAYVFALNVHLC